MAFRVRNQRNDDGTYTLSYGKGGNKLTATMQKIDGQWVSGVGPGHDTMKECKAAWQEWAEANYKKTGGAGNGSGTASKPARPAPPKLGSPPSLKPKESHPSPDSSDRADPFDPAKYDENRKLTPVGACDEVYNWAYRNRYRVLHPTLNVPVPPWDSVISVLQREFGKEKYPDLGGSDDRRYQPFDSTASGRLRGPR